MTFNLYGICIRFLRAAEAALDALVIDDDEVEDNRVLVPADRVQADTLSLFRGMNGCERCGYEGAIETRFTHGTGQYEQNDSYIIVEGDHLARQCPWCKATWLERPKNAEATYTPNTPDRDDSPSYA